ncbi:MAG: hypothetical protein IT535_02950 [Bauldia sp.]|nr:hypothetical protein [Bauldia sp.]
MSERDRIQERIIKKEQEIQLLEEKARAARVYLQALQDVLHLLADDDGESKTDSVPKAGSRVAQARDIITKRGDPVHINELLKAMGLNVDRENRASLTSALAAYVRRGEIFNRPAPNTFGLIALGHSSGAPAPSEPPSEFGLLTTQTVGGKG